LAIAAFIVVPKFLKPVYNSETVLLYREVIQTGSLLGARDAPRESVRQRNLRLQEMVLSRTNFEKIIKEMNLYPGTVAKHGMIAAVEELKKVTKCPVPEGDTFTIRHQGDDPDVVYEVTKRLAQSMVASSSQYRIEQAEATKQFLSAQATRAAEELNKSEQKLAEFLKIHPEFAHEVTAAGVRTTGAGVRAAERRNSESTDPAVQALERHAVRLKARADAPPNAPVGPEVDPAAAAALANAERERTAAQRDLQDKLARYTEQHPDVKTAERRLAAAQAAVARAKAAIPKAVAPPTSDKERKELKKQYSSLRAAISRAKKAKDDSSREAAAGRSERIVELETSWAGLTRTAAEARERNQQIQSRLRSATMFAEAMSSDRGSTMEIIDPAYKPKRPTKRGKKRTGAAGAAVVLLLGGLLMLGLALLDDRVYDETDLRRLNLGPLVHVTPKLPRRARGQPYV